MTWSRDPVGPWVCFLLACSVIHPCWLPSPPLDMHVFTCWCSYLYSHDNWWIKRGRGAAEVMESRLWSASTQSLLHWLHIVFQQNASFALLQMSDWQPVIISHVFFINTVEDSARCPPPWTRLDAPRARAALFVCVERLEMAESRDQSDNLGLQTRVRRHWNTETTHK